MSDIFFERENRKRRLNKDKLNKNLYKNLYLLIKPNKNLI